MCKYAYVDDKTIKKCREGITITVRIVVISDKEGAMMEAGMTEGVLDSQQNPIFNSQWCYKDVYLS